MAENTKINLQLQENITAGLGKISSQLSNLSTAMTQVAGSLTTVIGSIGKTSGVFSGATSDISKILTPIKNVKKEFISAKIEADKFEKSFRNLNSSTNMLKNLTDPYDASKTNKHNMYSGMFSELDERYKDFLINERIKSSNAVNSSRISSLPNITESKKSIVSDTINRSVGVKDVISDSLYLKQQKMYDNLFGAIKVKSEKTLSESGISGARSFYNGFTRTLGSVMLIRYAATVVTSEVMAVFNTFYDAVEKYKMDIAKTTANVLNLSVSNKNASPAEQYKLAKQYAEDLYKVQMKLSGSVVASSEEISKMMQTAQTYGFFLNPNDNKQIEDFKAVANAISIMSSGYANKEQQFAQEMRSLLTLFNSPSASLIKQLGGKAFVDKAKNLDAAGRLSLAAQGFQGYNIEAKNLQNTGELLKARFETVIQYIFKESFKGVYENINSSVRRFIDYIQENIDSIISYLTIGISTLVGLLKSLYEVFVLLTSPLRIIAGIISTLTGKSTTEVLSAMRMIVEFYLPQAIKGITTVFEILGKFIESALLLFSKGDILERRNSTKKEYESRLNNYNLWKEKATPSEVQADKYLKDENGNLSGRLAKLKMSEIAMLQAESSFQSNSFVDSQSKYNEAALLGRNRIDEFKKGEKEYYFKVGTEMGIIPKSAKERYVGDAPKANEFLSEEELKRQEKAWDMNAMLDTRKEYLEKQKELAEKAAEKQKRLDIRVIKEKYEIERDEWDKFNKTFSRLASKGKITNESMVNIDEATRQAKLNKQISEAQDLIKKDPENKEYYEEQISGYKRMKANMQDYYFALEDARESDKEKRIKDLEERKQLNKEKDIKERMQTAVGAMSVGFESVSDKWKETGEQMRSFGETVADSMASAFETGFFSLMQGEFTNLGDLLRQFANDVLRAYARIAAQKLALGIATSMSGGAAPQQSAGQAAGNALMMSAISAGIGSITGGLTAHTGGYIPRFHFGGLNKSERMAILQTGEGVLSRRGIENLGKLNGNGSVLERAEKVGTMSPTSLINVMKKVLPKQEVVVLNRVADDVVEKWITGSIGRKIIKNIVGV